MKIENFKSLLTKNKNRKVIINTKPATNDNCNDTFVRKTKCIILPSCIYGSSVYSNLIKYFQKAKFSQVKNFIYKTISEYMLS